MKLPYNSEPQPPIKKLGAGDIGILEFPVYYGLTPVEKQYIEEYTKDLPDIQAKLIDLAKKLGERLEEDAAALTEKLSNLGRYPELEAVLATHYQQEYSELIEASEARNKAEREAYVSALLIHRLGVADWKPEHIYNPEIIRNPLVDEIFFFAVNEEVGVRSEDL